MNSSEDIIESGLDPDVILHCSTEHVGGTEEATFLPFETAPSLAARALYAGEWGCLENFTRRAQSVTTGVTQDWEKSFGRLLEELSTQFPEKIQDEFRISVLEKNVHALTNWIRSIGTRKTTLVPIESFAPEPVEVCKPFFVVVAPDDDEFTATWFDANIAATGENEVEAVAILKDFIVAQFEQFSRLEKEENLGSGPQRELAIMKEFIRYRS